MKKTITTTIDENLYKEIQIIATTLGRNVNDLIEEGARMVRTKYAGKSEIIPKLKKDTS